MRGLSLSWCVQMGLRILMMGGWALHFASLGGSDGAGSDGGGSDADGSDGAGSDSGGSNGDV